MKKCIFLLVCVICLNLAACKFKKIQVKRMEYEIILINLWKKSPEQGGSSTEYHERLTNTVSILRDEHLINGASWDIIALNESFNIIDNHQSIPTPIQCSILGHEVLTGLCFDAHLCNTNQPENNTLHYGGNALLTRKTRMSPIGPSYQTYFNPWAGDPFGTAKRYSLVCQRFQLGNTNYILPVYVAKLPTNESPDLNRAHQLNEMVNYIKECWQEGDLTPLLIGDMNFIHTDPLGRKLEQDFIEIHRIIPDPGPAIEGIWIGKEKKFPDSRGTLEFIDYKLWNSAYVQGFTDHPIAYAKFDLLSWEGYRILNSFPIAKSIDRPAFTENAIAWTDAGPEGFIYLSSRRGDAGTKYSHELAYENQWKIRWPGADHDIRSLYGSALTYANGRTYLAWSGRVANKINVFSTTRILNTEWEGKRTKFDFFTDRAPALAAVGSRIFIAWKEMGSANIVLGWSDDEGKSWSTPRYVSPAQTDGTPALAEYQGRLMMSWIGHNDHHIWVASADANGNWDPTSFRKLGGEEECQFRASCVQSNYGPALLPVKAKERVIRQLAWQPPEDRLYLLWSGQLDNYIRIMSSPDGLDWSHATRVTDAKAYTAPSARFREDRFILGWSDLDSQFITLKETGIGGEISLDARK